MIVLSSGRRWIGWAVFTVNGTKNESMAEMESSRPWPWPRGSSRPANGVLGLGLGLEAVVLGLGLGLVCQVLGLGLGLAK